MMEGAEVGIKGAHLHQSLRMEEWKGVHEGEEGEGLVCVCV